MTDITLRMSPDVAASVAQHQEEIDRLGIIRSDLLNQFAAVQTTLRSREVERAKILNYHTPILSIPPELLSMIVRAGQSSRDPAQTGFCLPFEVLATHICSHLRQVLIGTRALWSSIHVAPGRSIERLEAYLTRSDGSLLDVRFELSRGLDWHTVSMPIRVVDMVFNHSRFWRRFTCETSQEEAQYPILGRLHRLDAPFLEYISLSVRGINPFNTASFRSSYHNDRPHILLSGTPKLSFIRLRGIAVYLFRPQLTSARILHLDLARSLPLPRHVFVHVLTASSHLTQLSIFGDIVPAGQKTRDRQDLICLPSLRSLRVCGFQESSYSGLLLAIDAPRLESLVLKGAHEHNLDSFCASANAKNFPRLQSLTFCNFELPQRVYMRLFSVLPTIITFNIFFTCQSAPTIFQILGRSDQTPGSTENHIPWPKLRTISCLLDVRDRMLIEKAVKSRRDCGYPLSRLRFGTLDVSSLTQFQFGSDVIVEEFTSINGWHAGLDCDYDDNLSS